MVWNAKALNYSKKQTARVSTEVPWARQVSTGPLRACTASPTPRGSARKAIVFQRGVWPLRGTKGCPSQNTAAADVPHRIPTACMGAHRRRSLGGYTNPSPQGSSLGQWPCPGKPFLKSPLQVLPDSRIHHPAPSYQRSSHGSPEPHSRARCLELSKAAHTG